MSTIHFSTHEWGCIVTGWVASGALPFNVARDVAALAARSNARAYSDHYSETVEPDQIPSADEIEASALPILAQPETWLSLHMGGVVYNCAEDPQLSQPIDSLGGSSLAEFLEPVEQTTRKWHDRLQDAKKRKEENDAAFADEGPLPVVPWSEIGEMAQRKGCARIIVAEFSVDESDMQSDYHGGRTARTVVIGFGKGKRESFRELRKAAAVFEPTEYIAFDRISVHCLFKIDNDHYERSESLKGENYRDRYFRTEEEAAQCVADLIANAPENQLGYSGCVGFPAFAKARPESVQYTRRSPEHRENYSMGGGNYLGWSRHGGWSVYSVSVDYYAKTSGGVEFYEPPAVVKNGKPVVLVPDIPRPPRKEKPAFPIWSSKGTLQLQATDGYDWPHCYRTPETAQRDADRLAAMGIVATVVRGRRKAAYFVKLVSQTETQDTPPHAELARFDLLSVL